QGPSVFKTAAARPTRLTHPVNLHCEEKSLSYLILQNESLPVAADCANHRARFFSSSQCRLSSTLGASLPKYYPYLSPQNLKIVGSSDIAIRQSCTISKVLMSGDKREG